VQNINAATLTADLEENKWKQQTITADVSHEKIVQTVKDQE